MLSNAEGKSGLVRFLGYGDINIRGRSDPVEVFDLVRAELASADVRFANMEMCLYRPDAYLPAKPDWLQPRANTWFHSEPDMVACLIDGGIDLVGCANNIIFGEEATLSTIETLDGAGIGHCGIGTNKSEARAPLIVERGGLRFGFLARTAVVFSPYGHAATDTSAGAATIRCHTAYEAHPRVHEAPGLPATTRTWPDPNELAELCAEVTDLRSKVDVVITNFHWGVPRNEEVAEYQRLVARAVIDCGADLVMGSHIHVPQGIEVYKGKVIYYGLGNFVFDRGQGRSEGHAGLVADVLFNGREIVRAAFRAMVRTDDDKNRPQILSPDDLQFGAIMDHTIELSSELGTAVERTGQDAVVIGPLEASWERNLEH